MENNEEAMCKVSLRMCFIIIILILHNLSADFFLIFIISQILVWSI